MIGPLVILALLAAAPVDRRFHDTGAIDVAVAAFTGHRAAEPGGARAAVDPRLRLAACRLPRLDWRGSYRDAVVVTCDLPRWRIYVPVLPAARDAPVGAVEPVIRRGDPVSVEAGTDGFAITREGVALSDAAAGARLLVRVDPAKSPIQAVAIETGRAALPGWTR